MFFIMSLKNKNNRSHSPTPLVFIFNKPYGVLSQFSPAGDRLTLKSFGPFQNDIYPVGRLDAESEGLLILTNDNRIKHTLLDPKFEHPRTYLAQVERIPSESALNQLMDGLVLHGIKTRPSIARLLNEEPMVPPRTKPIRFRKNVPTSWIELTLKEGRNHQVRRMMAAINHPCVRLIRVKIGNLALDSLLPGYFHRLSMEEVQDLFE
ncbi:MAG: pseudouridine synthase [bacterium]